MGGSGRSRKGGTSVAHISGARVRFLSFVAATRNVKNLLQILARMTLEHRVRQHGDSLALRAIVLAHHGLGLAPEVARL